MLSNDFPKLAEDLALISKLAGGQTADSAIVPSVKAHAVRRACLSQLPHLHARVTCETLLSRDSPARTLDQ